LRLQVSYVEQKVTSPKKNRKKQRKINIPLLNTHTPSETFLKNEPGKAYEQIASSFKKESGD